MARARDNLFFIRHEDATPYTFFRRGCPASVWAWESIRALRDGVYVWADEASAEDVTGVCASPVYVWRAEDVTEVCASPLGGARNHKSNKTNSCLFIHNPHVLASAEPAASATAKIAAITRRIFLYWAMQSIHF